MPSLIYFVAATDFSLDSLTNNLTLFKVIEQIRGPGPEFAYPRLALVSVWLYDDSDADCRFAQRIRLISPNGKTAFESEVPFVHEAGKTRHRLFMQVGGLVFKSSGRHHFQVVVKQDGDKDYPAEAAGSYPIDVVFREGDTEQLTQSKD